MGLVTNVNPFFTEAARSVNAEGDEGVFVQIKLAT